MKLKEKFLKLTNKGSYFVIPIEEDAILCEQLADEFAVQFADWLLINDTPENAEQWFGYTNKEMLNAFKKEKGL